jgi:hypothetical protein
MYSILILHFANHHDLGKMISVKGSWQLEDSIQSKIIALAFSMAAKFDFVINPAIYCLSLQYDRSESTQLAQEKWN